MNRVLVTGATGFLGRHVTETLLRSPHAAIVRILTRGTNPWPAEPRLECVEGDILDPATVRAAVAGCDAVLHLAGMVRRDPRSREAMRRVHVEGSRNVSDAVLGQGRPRLVVASTSGTIAVSRRPVVHDESSPEATDIIRDWPYYMSKLEQERLLLDLHERKALEVILLNPSILYGPGDVHRSSTDDIRLFLDRQIPNVPSGGLNFVDARDAARTFVSALGSGRPGERYLVGGHDLPLGEFFSLLERVSDVPAPRLRLPEAAARAGAALLRALARARGSLYPVDDTSIRMAYHFWYCDSRRAREELGHAVRPAEETLRDTVEFIRREVDD